MDSNRKYFGMTASQLGIIGGLALLACCLFAIGGWLIFGGGLNAANPQPILPAANSTATLIVLPTLTPTSLPTPIPYEQLIPNGWAQHRTALVEIWLPAAFKDAKTPPKGLAIAALPELIISQSKSTTSQYAKWVVLSYEPLTADSLDAFIDLKLQSVPSPARLSSRSADTLNGMPAEKILIETRVDNLDVNELTYIVQDGGTVWYVTFRAQINDFYADLEMFNASSETFRLVK